jgi:hypothetical protein
VLRGKLGEMLNVVLGRQAHKAELGAWFSVSLTLAGPMMCPTHSVHAMSAGVTILGLPIGCSAHIS